MSDCNIHWTQYFSALGPTLIAMFVAYIAYKQWRLSEDNLRERLFDRRIGVFSKSLELLREATSYSDAQRAYKIVFEFRDLSESAYFLFGPEIRELLNEASERTLQKLQAERRIEREKPSGSSFDEITSEIQSHDQWFSNNASELFKKFEKDLSLKGR